MKKNIAILCIVAFNIVPIFGVAFFNWQPFEAFWFFWVETLIMSLFNSIRIVFSQARPLQSLDSQAPLEYNINKAVKYMFIRFAIFIFYAIFIITFIGFVANVNKDKGTVLATLLFQNKLFNLGLLISICSQGYFLITGFFRNRVYLTANPNNYTAVFDGRQLVVHIAIVVGALGSIFLMKKTSYGNYSSIFIICLLCICKCIFDLLNNNIEYKKNEVVLK